ncbi:hypothetical protein MKA37_22135 [[Clostridium] innocuum]|mgnify:FL=1|jgi:hypothetical protein|nr:hypothetical protein [[Clostridium] innocuum]MCR0522443.1 hypothetical protein [[Clostridium] innocuum]
MELKVWKDQRTVAKVYECNNYDLMWGTVEDMLSILDKVESLNTESEEKSTQIMFNLVSESRPKVNELLKDMFPDITDQDLRKIKTKDIVMLIVELMSYVKHTFKSSDSPNA